jgi:hypothetical protein
MQDNSLKKNDFSLKQFCNIIDFANNFVKSSHKLKRSYILVKSNYGCMYKLNLIAFVSIVAAVSLVVGMTSPAVFAQDNMTMNMGNMSSAGNMTVGNATSGNLTQTESLPSAGETGYSGNNPILP